MIWIHVRLLYLSTLYLDNRILVFKSHRQFIPVTATVKYTSTSFLIVLLSHIASFPDCGLNKHTYREREMETSENAECTMGIPPEV